MTMREKLLVDVNGTCTRPQARPPVPPTNAVPLQKFLCAKAFTWSVWCCCWLVFLLCVGGGGGGVVMCHDLMWYDVMCLVGR